MSKGPGRTGGAEGTRTPDPHTASVVRYQLRHSPLVQGQAYKTLGSALSAITPARAGRLTEQGAEASVVSLESPTTLELHQRRPAGVAQGRQSPPGRRIECQKDADESAGGTAMGHEQQVTGRRQVVQDDGCGSGAHGSGVLTPDGDPLPSAPGGVLLRPGRRHLRTRQALPRPEVRLPQAGVENERQPDVLADRFSGTAGTHQVRADHRRRWVGGEDGPEGVSLGKADVVEGDVELSLDPAVSVVRRTPVAEQDQTPRCRPAQCRPAQCRPAQCRPAARAMSASTNGITGQSFQSRSRA